jgi:hypothetical protein
MDISDERLQNAVQAVVPQFQTMASAQGRNGLVSELNIVEAQSQVVAGINYFVKVGQRLPLRQNVAPTRATRVLTMHPPCSQSVSNMHVVAGTQVHLGHDEYAHMRIYDHFGDVELTDIQLSKSKTDRLEYF